MSGGDGSDIGGGAGWPIPIIDAAKCAGCGLCVEACPNEALSLLDGCAVVSKPDACMYTGNCELICPEDAISRPFQLIFVDRSRSDAMETTVIADLKDQVVFSSGMPQPQVLGEDPRIKVIVAGLEPGARIPVHPEASSMYYILEGSGLMTVDDRQFAVQPGMVILTPDGAARGIEAHTRLSFLATRIA